MKYCGNCVKKSRRVPAQSWNKTKEPPRPAAALRGLLTRASWRAALRGDLDCIAMKALEKDRNRRYGTPSELVADIRRYLNNEPVMARPASAGYRLQKYVRRHRAAAAVAAGLVLLLAGFAAVQAMQLRRITRERDRADRVTDFMSWHVQGVRSQRSPRQQHYGP